MGPTDESRTSVAGSGSRAGAWYLAWLALGGGYALALLSIMSIGIFLLPVVVGLTVLVSIQPGARSGRVGLVSGLGLPLLYIAYLNRDGPGTVCSTTPTSVSCSDQWNPWPWLVAGVAFIAIGLAIFRASSRPKR